MRTGKATWLSAALGIGLAAATAGAWELTAYSEFFRVRPDGTLLGTDVAGSASAIKPLWSLRDGPLLLRCPRRGYTSFHLIVRDEKGGPFELKATCEVEGVEIDLYREWFHASRRNRQRVADVLIPVRADAKLRLPDAEMKIPDQQAAAFWVDVWVGEAARPGRSDATLTLTAGGKTTALPLRIEVLELTVPEEDAVIIDHNSYSYHAPGMIFPNRRRRLERSGKPWPGSDAFYASIHAIHRYFHEHRQLFHQLGYSHSGLVHPWFAPKLAGSGRTRRVESWEPYDKHYGPLCDGTAFAGSRMGSRPVRFVYLPINPNWPAQYLWYGRPGYEAEFVNVVAALEKHLREKGWTKTIFEMFFNHKKRYKAFEWDGDESKFAHDDECFREFGRLLKKAVPADSPVQFRFRNDASWRMRNQMDTLAGVVDFWVCSGGIISFYPEAPKLLADRGDILWTYGGAPSAYGGTSSLIGTPLRVWMMGAGGIVYWQTASPGRDPWFNYDGGRHCTMYSGDRFGLDEILAPMRVKIQRNVVQDLALLEQIAKVRGREKVRKEVAALGGSTPESYWTPDAPARKIPPEDWTNRSIHAGVQRKRTPGEGRDARWWLEVRRYILQHAKGIR